MLHCANPTCEDHLAGHEYEQHNLGVLHAVDQAREQLRLILQQQDTAAGSRKEQQEGLLRDTAECFTPPSMQRRHGRKINSRPCACCTTPPPGSPPFIRPTVCRSRLMTHCCEVAVRHAQPLQADGELDVAGADDVLNLELLHG